MQMQNPTAGRFTDLTTVAHVDLPPDLTRESAKGLVQRTARAKPALGHFNWRRWSDVNLDVFLVSLCKGQA